MSAWQHGVVSDGDLEWEKRCLQLARYAQEHGDAHIGYRDNEDSDLVRWARKQRHSHKLQTLRADRCCEHYELLLVCGSAALCLHILWLGKATQMDRSHKQFCPQCFAVQLHASPPQ